MGNSGADSGTQASHVAKGKLQQIRMALHLNKKPNSQKIVTVLCSMVEESIS